jgi:Replication-relaxation
MSRRYFTAAAVRALADRLTERDWLVLRKVCALRFLTGSQLCRLCFLDSDDPQVNARAARRSLLRLTRLGVLARLPRAVGGVRAGSAGYVYRLGRGGERLAVRRGLLPGPIRRRSLTPGTLFLRHALLVAELHTQLTECERSGGFELLELSAEPSCWREMDGLGTQRLKPDTFVRLGLGPYEDSYFIEVDRATEGSRAIERQCARYVAYHHGGAEQAARGVFPRVLWLATTTGRVRAIEDCIERLPVGDRELFETSVFDRVLEVLHVESPPAMDGRKGVSDGVPSKECVSDGPC